MKTHLLLILTIIRCNFCYSQKLDKDIEKVKQEIIGTWRHTDTTSQIKSRYHFTSKRVTYIVRCPDNIVLKRTMRYTLKKEYISELNRSIITIVLPIDAKRLPSHDCNFCEEKTLSHEAFNDWADVSISKNIMTSCYDFSKNDTYTTLLKE